MDKFLAGFPPVHGDRGLVEDVLFGRVVTVTISVA